MNFKHVIIFLVSLIGMLSQANGAKILAAFVFPAKSHFMMTKALVEGLLDRGHQVTLLTSHTVGSKSSNYNEILLDPPYNFWPDIKELFHAESLFDLTKLNTIDFFKMLIKLGTKTTEYALENTKIQKIINDTAIDSKGRKKYDLLLVEQFFQEAFLALSVKFDIPVVSVCTFGYSNYQSQMMGVITPYSFVPHHFLSLNDRMDFSERFYSTIVSMYDDFVREFIYFPKQDKLVKKYFSHLNLKIPKVSRMEKKLSLMLINGHAPLSDPRPHVPNMIPVGGLHIKKPKPLPKDIQDFLDGSKNGVIYFNLGTNVRSSEMPPEKVKMFLQVFAKLNQRILWKWEDDKIPKLPKNVKVMNWMPQNDILAHENVKVFITHGGLMGTQEGVYHGVPMLGIPVYCDQYLNLGKASKSGYAVMLDYQTLTKKGLEEALDQLLNNSTYMENIKKFSQIFRDRPMPALETSMYWIEYVIRYNGAPQIQSTGRTLPWYQLYLLDVIGTIIGSIVGCIFLFIFLIKMLLKKFGSKTDDSGSKKKKKH